MGNWKSKEQQMLQVRRIVDRLWLSVSDDNRIGSQELYCAILLVYNEINKTVPGPWNDPPTREEVEELMKKFDGDHDGKLDHDEFVAFLKSFTRNVSSKIGMNILIFSFVVPLLVLAVRRITEEIPKVGVIVKRIPDVLFTPVATTAIVMLGTHYRGGFH